MTEIISELSPEQEALIRVYREKWRKIALSTERIDREKAAEAVKTAYTAIRKQDPEIIFCDSPYAGLKIVIHKQLKQRLNTELTNQLLQPLINEVRQKVTLQVHEVIALKISTSLPLKLITLADSLRDELKIKLQSSNLRNPWFKPQLLTSVCSWLDFYTSILKCSYNQTKWQALQLLVKYCNWILPYEKICIICDRPIHLHFDNENRLHALM
jgi:hypothetical protein